MEKDKNRQWIKPVQAGNVRIENNVFLAPMAGGSELSFRKICHRMGAGLVYTELATARGIRYQKSFEKNYRYLEISPEEFPVSIQLFASDPLDFEAAIPIIFTHPLLSKCAMIDINMGCPVQKVVKTGAGCALMKTPSLAADIIRTCVRICPAPVSVKFRKGWNDSSVNAVDFARMCEDCGASLITVHGRTASQMYSGKADWEIIRQVKEAVSIPVIGNGDVTSGATARALFEQTGADGVMVGRAALGNPWIFSEILNELGGKASGQPDNPEGGAFQKPSIDERRDIMIEHMRGAVAQLGEPTAIKEMRKHFAWYLKGVPGSVKYKVPLMQCSTMAEALQILKDLK